MSDFINFGLKSYSGDDIVFAKYNFESNKSKSTIHEYLELNGYGGKQYIGFFTLESVISEDIEGHAMARKVGNNLEDRVFTHAKFKNYSNC